MLGLAWGEIVVLAFILVAILTARFWPVFGERVGRALSKRSVSDPSSREP
jgi:hypothetical protein